MIKNELMLTEKQSILKEKQPEKTFAELLQEKLPELIQEHWINLHSK